MQHVLHFQHWRHPTLIGAIDFREEPEITADPGSTGPRVHAAERPCTGPLRDNLACPPYDPGP
jgi:hypothetical protein